MSEERRFDNPFSKDTKRPESDRDRFALSFALNKVGSLFTHAYNRVYFAQEMRQQEDFTRKSKKHQLQLIERDKLNKETTQRVLQFFGLPSGDQKGPRKILKRLTGWNENYSPSRNLLQAVIIFPINLLLTASKFTLNVVKLATEFLPYLLAKGSLGVFNHIESIISELRSSISRAGDINSLVIGLKLLPAFIGLFLVGIITTACHLGYFIGGAITSPVENFRAAYNAGKDVGGSKHGKVVGRFFALFSALTTASVYLFLFPLAIKLLVTQAPAVLPTIAHAISQFVGIFSAQAGASVAGFLTITLPTALANFGLMIANAFTITGIDIFLIGLGTAAAIGFFAATPTVAAIDAIGEKEVQRDSFLSNIVQKTDNYNPYYHSPLLSKFISGVIQTIADEDEDKKISTAMLLPPLNPMIGCSNYFIWAMKWGGLYEDPE